MPFADDVTIPEFIDLVSIIFIDPRRVRAGLNGDFPLMCGIVAKPARTAIAFIGVGAGLNGDFALMCGIFAKPARTAIAFI